MYSKFIKSTPLLLLLTIYNIKFELFTNVCSLVA
nr:MAG TPA_asm: hypothetical protein [Caudoviricetes sp.]